MSALLICPLIANAYPITSLLPFESSERFFTKASLSFFSFLFSSESCRLEAEAFAVTSTVTLADIFFCAFATSFHTSACEPLPATVTTSDTDPVVPLPAPDAEAGGGAPADPSPIPSPLPDPVPERVPLVAILSSFETMRSSDDENSFL